MAKGLASLVCLAILAPSEAAAEGAPDDRAASRRAFVPHVLAVATGTVVDFPNSDQVRNSIDSFSAAKRFEVRLDRRFEAPLVVSREIELPAASPLVIPLGETPPPRPPARPEPDPLQSLFGATPK